MNIAEPRLPISRKYRCYCM